MLHVTARFQSMEMLASNSQQDLESQQDLAIGCENFKGVNQPD